MIKRSKIQQQFKFKLLSVYYPDKFFPVCTMKAARGYCDCLGIEYNVSDKMDDLNRYLVEWKEQYMPDWTLHQTMAFADGLWRGKKRYTITDTKKDIVIAKETAIAIMSD